MASRDANDIAGEAPSGSERIRALIRLLRQRRFLTQEQLAIHAGLDVRTVRRLEARAHGRPRSESLSRLANALDLTPTERAALSAAGETVQTAAHAPAQGVPAEQDPAATRPAQLLISAPGFARRIAFVRRVRLHGLESCAAHTSVKATGRMTVRVTVADSA